MDTLLEGAPVVEQVEEVTVGLRRRAEELLRYVEGEYEDEDGDRATGFILVDAPPAAAAVGGVWKQQSRGSLKRDWSSAQGKKKRGTGFGEGFGGEGIGASGSSSESNVRSGSQGGAECSSSEFRRGFSDLDMRGRRKEAPQFGSSSSSSMERQRVVVNVGFESWNEEHVYFISDDDEDDDPSFFCELCEESVGLDSIFQMLTCPCLFCTRCLRRHAESFLCEATQLFGTAQRSVPIGSMDIDCDVIEVGMSDNLTGWEQKGKGTNNLADASIVERTAPGEPLEWISCPKASCSGRFPLSSSQLLAPEAFRKWEEAANEAFFKENAAFVRCPGCKTVFEKVVGVVPLGVALTGVPELDRTAPFIELDNEGRRLSRSAMCHKATNRFRCRLCTIDFCGACLEVPYHLGKSCEEVVEEKNAIKCLYCEAPLGNSRKWFTEKDLNLRSVKDLQKQLEREGVDAAWCVEKKDLVAVHRFVAGICEAKDCRKRASLSCTRSLECGHRCGGVRGERLCLPCLEEECQHNASTRLGNQFLPAATDFCGICLVEPLRHAPSIQLQCGHVVHMHCARQKLAQGFPGPAISFGYLNCPQCPKAMQHVMLDADMRKHLELMRLVREKAVKRLTMEGVAKSAKELQPGGNFAERPSEYALHLYQYYMCCKCLSPYCGGKRDCMASDRERDNESHNPLDLVCGGCSAAGGGHGLCSKGHGRDYIEFKCCYCCSPATYFCFGRTHFCDSCHNSRPDMQKTFVPLLCRGPEWCPLQISHFPNGQECCLGCSMCRFTGQ